MELVQARRRARDMLARIRAGGNPADDIRREKETPTLREFADEYLRRCDPYWKPSGRKTIRIYLNARILPAFGRMPSTASAPRTWPRGSTRRAGTGPARPTAPSRYCAR